MSILDNLKSESASIANTLRALSDEKSLALFNMVAFTLPQDTGVVTTRSALARKPYYSRLKHLINAGLVTKKSGKYFLTSFGKEVYEFHILIGRAVENYWKLKAIDSIELIIPDKDLSAEKRRSLIDSLIESSAIKNILLEWFLVDGSASRLLFNSYEGLNHYKTDK